MIVYQVIKDCVISFRCDKNSNEFCLNVGDYIFLSDEKYWIKANDKDDIRLDTYISLSLLKNIYYKKMVDFNGKYEWVWIKDINIINPMLNYKNTINSNHGKIYLNDVSIVWNRDEKINNILN
jgi:hypothetical protein